MASGNGKVCEHDLAVAGQGRGMMDSKGRLGMTAREELHRLVDELPEPQLPEVRLFIEDLKADADGEALSAETLAAIEEGLEDIRAGRTLSWDQIKRENGL